jgi:hypothetical protein
LWAFSFEIKIDNSFPIDDGHQMETWKKIEGFESYEVSDLGRVRRRGKVLKGNADKDGYLRVGLCKDGTLKQMSIHRLVGCAFIPNPEGKPTINHIDEDKANNHLTNLEWATHSEQHIHSPVPIGKSGHRHIYQRKSGSWEVDVSRECVRVFQKTFPTLQEAITARDAFLNQS